ncbi:hypothetical protein HQ520_19085, partial [bacterium]|nr:hypothetical protein [bacterium]
RPEIVKSNASGKVLLQDSETLVIGGLQSRRMVSQRSRIPVLGWIPFLGWFFTFHEMKEETVDVLFLITPHVLPPGVNPVLPFDFENSEIVRQISERLEE